MTRPPMRRADREAQRERDVEQRVAGLELAVGLERRGDRRARQRAPDEREDPVRRGQHEHERRATGDEVSSASAAKIAASAR